MRRISSCLVWSVQRDSLMDIIKKQQSPAMRSCLSSGSRVIFGLVSISSYRACVSSCNTIQISLYKAILFIFSTHTNEKTSLPPLPQSLWYHPELMWMIRPKWYIWHPLMIRDITYHDDILTRGLSKIRHRLSRHTKECHSRYKQNYRSRIKYRHWLCRETRWWKRLRHECRIRR